MPEYGNFREVIRGQCEDGNLHMTSNDLDIHIVRSRIIFGIDLYKKRESIEEP